ncbi:MULTISPECIES: substrate-binding domain-containing protein [Mycobacterium]|uniref:substrate-binding domain-containing protein n=1 Tax=Mycobacterium TaxID=1763 RepID=UPI001CD99551|nr:MULTISPECIES: substrate-binding domain-containing protein [Mycobacterium]MCA2244540.1 substrate-binding domain-containing protein [Mycobacterium sp. WUMAC-067]MCA2316082.1 substrate-binding domain-containing protein [Mycobacterium sp. WUMAC-025]MEE3752802.1 substrate-binding domain-containing protein [Mycobacterium intracellulare]
MGRHSAPDPDDSLDEPSRDDAVDEPSRGDDAGHQRRDAGAGEAADEDYYSDADDFADEDYYSDERHYADDEEPYADDEPYAAGDAFADSTADEYPEFPPRQPAPSSAEPPAASPSLFRGGHRGLTDWRGGHRSEGGRRGVSIGVIVALIAVVVVVGSVILWSFFGDVLSKRSHNAAGRCVGGQETVAVVADPSIATAVQEFAESYNKSAGPVGDRCMVVNVKPADSDAVLNGFIGKWPAELGGQPALWIPGSSISAARLAGATAQKTISESHSLVSSPVVLAVRPELAPALAKQNWAALPGLQTNPNALAALNLPAWGSLRLALPTGGNGDASFLAGEAVAAASVPPGAPVTQGTGAVRTLLSAQPKLADSSLTEAMNTLLKPGDAATAPVHAVITTEQQLFQRGQSLQDAKSALASWLPPGPAPVADYPTVLLSGSWLTREQATAASEFSRFMHKPDQLAKLAKAGFRVNGVKTPSSPVTAFPALPSTLSIGDDPMRATLAEAMAAPSAGQATTIMLDQSMPGQEGAKSRLANVIAALQDRIKALPPTAVVGLWTFDGHEGRSEVASGPLADTVNGQPRSAALSAALDKQYSSGGGAVSFTTLRMIYQDMQANYRAGQANSLLVITAGPHTDQSLDGPGLQDFIRKSADPAKPIAVNVINFGADPDRSTWEAVAQLSGGSYQNIATSASPELATAINAFLS